MVLIPTPIPKMIFQRIKMELYNFQTRVFQSLGQELAFLE
jgi:hypothetical protein